MIQKVNRPAYLSLINGAKQAESDPGSSQGSGMAYNGPPQQTQNQPQEQKSTPDQNPSDSDPPTPHLSVVSNEKMGMTEVVKDLLEQKKNAEPAPQNSGLTTRYSAGAGTVKGMLLNRKAE